MLTLTEIEQAAVDIRWIERQLTQMARNDKRMEVWKAKVVK